MIYLRQFGRIACAGVGGGRRNMWHIVIHPRRALWGCCSSYDTKGIGELRGEWHIGRRANIMRLILTADGRIHARTHRSGSRTPSARKLLWPWDTMRPLVEPTLIANL
jgi:hypothetical protein